jgi:hypothetical protein
MRPQLSPRVIFLSLCLILCICLASFLSGCKKEPLPDQDYIREDASDLKTHVREGRSFMPQGTGAVWRYDVTGQVLEVEVVTNKKDQGATTQYQEERRALPPITKGEFTFYPTKRRIKENDLEGEVFVESATGFFLQKGVFLYKDKASEVVMEMQPPLSLVKYPMREGEMIPWTGKLSYLGQNYPAQGTSRMTRKETINTAQGAMDAYRIDTRIYSIDQKTAYTLTMRWFVPERGMMQMRMVRPKELLSYALRK